MNEIKFDQTGGFPFDLDTLNAMQTAYQQLQEYGALAGDKSIISGCQTSGGSIGDGFVFYQGELLRFKGGIQQNTVKVFETKTSKIFEDGNSKEALVTRWMACGTGIGTVPWSDFKRPDTTQSLTTKTADLKTKTDGLTTKTTDLKTKTDGLTTKTTGLKTKTDSLTTKTDKLITSALFLNEIRMYAGSVSRLPTGWKLCDGSHGTADLRGRFVVGYDTRKGDYNAIGDNGGAASVTLTKDQMPRHNHGGKTGKIPLVKDDRRAGSGSSSFTSSSRGELQTASITSDGGGQAHENRPPYYTLAFIQYKG